jgi:hypothetical protein
LPENTAFSIGGVNLYRSFDSESGPYHKVNSEHLSSGIYRDKTTNNLISDESVQNLERGLNPQKEWRFKTKFFPIVKNSIEVGKTLLEGNLADSKDIVVNSILFEDLNFDIAASYTACLFNISFLKLGLLLENSTLNEA